MLPVAEGGAAGDGEVPAGARRPAGEIRAGGEIMSKVSPTQQTSSVSLI